ncbi:MULTISPECIES: helix-turn-helix domain-containing protein [Brevibacillus]|uniref:Helix-turn-helix domain-containing protein n=3 Tax=Brevibacillus TaxID=55080 RepID=A0ABY9T5L2_BREBE|nr:MULTISPECIES: helix-turn-helix domain-containing protein [Brevibacillus]MCG5251592.1 helix-turn-helix domain-containing protein [Brevibacillus agri]MDA5109324.1 helix-turn-helix domain-containing protein [Brevibacillus thermoruber]MED4572623.1 helix-turn-helix domain-containing protein [Brevibacillus agri]RNB56530.1 DNA-binding protein [Brevibacillus gelatini]WNC13129.1 helix-turn-helix domain-containing protein [Brevibacillus brevis]
MNQGILTPAECAKYIGVHRDTIYAMVRKKEIPHFRVRSRIFFRVESIDAWMREQEQKNTKSSA